MVTFFLLAPQVSADQTPHGSIYIDGNSDFADKNDDDVAIATQEVEAQENTLPNRRTGTFFYPWYGHYRHWYEGGYSPPDTWSSNYLPDLKPAEFDPSKELYDSSNKSVIKWQLKLMKKAGIRFAISSWWGKDSYEDQVFRKILTDVMNDPDCPYRDLKWCIYYEEEGYSDPSVEKIVNDLEYVINNYGDLPYYYKINEKPVIFVYGWGVDESGENYADRWRQVRDNLSIYVNLKVVSDYHNFSDYADSWHQYAPAMRYEEQGNYSAFASPGFWRYDEEPRLQRDSIEFATATENLTESGARFLLIETWNEWHEGTQVEPGQPIDDNNSPFVPAGDSYENTYIDILDNHFQPLMPEPMDIKFISPQENAIFENQEITVEVKVRDPYSDNVQAYISVDNDDFCQMVYSEEDNQDYAYFKYTNKFSGGDHEIVVYAKDENRYFSKNAKIGFATPGPVGGVFSSADGGDDGERIRDDYPRRG